MTNAMRGEVDIDLGGRRLVLCLTLGALAEIETALGGDNLAAAIARLKAPSARQLVAILGALVRGGGTAISDSDIAAMRLDIGKAVEAIGAAFVVAGLGDGP